MPSWTWIDEETETISEEEMERRRPALDALAQRLTAIRETREHRGWERQARIEDGDDGPEYDTAEEAEQAQHADSERRRVERIVEEAQENALLSEMHRLGARLMRPYEHWNEDERYMQYMECGRFGE